MKRMLLLLVALLTACQRVRIEPVDLAADDMCSFCRMAISEKQFATEFLDKDGTVFKFDDSACMRNYIKNRIKRQDILASFVMDYETRRWLKAEDAFYVRSAQIRTPMMGGIIAFAEKAKAEAAAAKLGGRLLGFDEVF